MKAIDVARTLGELARLEALVAALDATLDVCDDVLDRERETRTATHVSLSDATTFELLLDVELLPEWEIDIWEPLEAALAYVRNQARAKADALMIDEAGDGDESAPRWLDANAMHGLIDRGEYYPESEDRGQCVAEPADAASQLPCYRWDSVFQMWRRLD